MHTNQHDTKHSFTYLSRSGIRRQQCARNVVRGGKGLGGCPQAGAVAQVDRQVAPRPIYCSEGPAVLRMTAGLGIHGQQEGDADESEHARGGGGRGGPPTPHYVPIVIN